jgi:ATPase subunit of ABC transporter with duplicated ATPase domains
LPILIARAQLDEHKTSGRILAAATTRSQWRRFTPFVGYLQDFLFSRADLSPVSSLSGGEQNRLLWRNSSSSIIVLVLDEPTNDLDAETLDLPDRLFEYNGTI